MVRPTRLRFSLAKLILSLILGVLGVFVLTGVWVIAPKQWFNEQTFGIIAEVFDRSTLTGKHRCARIKYQVNGQEFMAPAFTCSNHDMGSSLLIRDFGMPGESIQVLYNRDNPRQMITEPEQVVLNMVFLLVGAVLLAMSILMWAPVLRRPNKITLRTEPPLAR